MICARLCTVVLNQSWGPHKARFLPSNTHFEKRRQSNAVNSMGDVGQTNLGSKATSAMYCIDRTLGESCTEHPCTSFNSYKYVN